MFDQKLTAKEQCFKVFENQDGDFCHISGTLLRTAQSPLDPAASLSFGFGSATVFKGGGEDRGRKVKHQKWTTFYYAFYAYEYEHG